MNSYLGRNNNYFDFSLASPFYNLYLKFDINKDLFEDNSLQYKVFHKNGELFFKDSLGDVCSNRFINFYDDKGLRIGSISKIKFYYYLG